MTGPTQSSEVVATLAHAAIFAARIHESATSPLTAPLPPTPEIKCEDVPPAQYALGQHMLIGRSHADARLCTIDASGIINVIDGSNRSDGLLDQLTALPWRRPSANLELPDALNHEMLGHDLHIFAAVLTTVPPALTKFAAALPALREQLEANKTSAIGNVLRDAQALSDAVKLTTTDISKVSSDAVRGFTEKSIHRARLT